MIINPKIKEKIVLALDVDTIEQAKSLIKELKDYVGVFKVGLQFYTANGGEIFDFMKAEGVEYFFDVKLMDIPNTVKKASENIIRSGASFFNVHSMGGSPMMQAAREGANKVADELGRKEPVILAVTVLTSINDRILNKELNIQMETQDAVVEFAKLAKVSGMSGVVASVHEAKQIKQACGKDFKVLCPGIRPEWSSKQDQKRPATPAYAIRQGADYLVIGRAVTGAENHIEAMQKIYAEIEETLYDGDTTFSKTNLSARKAKVLLANGLIFEGNSFGAKGTAFGEICFNTSMSGYQEMLTDPSYSEQVVVMTYPEIGNSGINAQDMESDKVWVKGLIVKDYCKTESHYMSSKKLGNYLAENNVVAISDVDTRNLTKIIRDNGSMACVITTESITPQMREELKKYQISKNVAYSASRKDIKKIEGTGVKLAVIDLGLKNSVINNLLSYKCDLTIYPATVDSQTILNEKYDAVLFSNGPGNPQDIESVIEMVNNLVGQIPLYGICLGGQVLAIASGAKTYKLKYGHRGVNYPVLNLENNKVLITSQNHAYAIDETSLGSGVEVTYKNLNDGTLEGFKCSQKMIEAVQFYPETSASTNGKCKILDNWMEQIEQYKKVLV